MSFWLIGWNVVYNYRCNKSDQSVCVCVCVHPTRGTELVWLLEALASAEGHASLCRSHSRLEEAQPSHLSCSQRALVVLQVQGQLVVGRLQVLVTNLNTQGRGRGRRTAGVVSHLCD